MPQTPIETLAQQRWDAARRYLRLNDILRVQRNAGRTVSDGQQIQLLDAADTYDGLSRQWRSRTDAHKLVAALLEG